MVVLIQSRVRSGCSWKSSCFDCVKCRIYSLWLMINFSFSLSLPLSIFGVGGWKCGLFVVEAWILSEFLVIVICDIWVCSFAWAWDLVLEACFLVDGVCSFGFVDLIWLLSGFWVDATFVWLLRKCERNDHLWVWGDWTNALFGWWENLVGYNWTFRSMVCVLILVKERFLFSWLPNNVMFKIQNLGFSFFLHILLLMRYDFYDLWSELYLGIELHRGLRNDFMISNVGQVHWMNWRSKVCCESCRVSHAPLLYLSLVTIILKHFYWRVIYFNVWCRQVCMRSLFTQVVFLARQ